jgi:NosR/NirI family nitrous oxide reductase transcriptional regulator
LRGLDKFLLISGVLAVVSTSVIRHFITDGDVGDSSFPRSLFPQAERFTSQAEPPPHYRAFARNWDTGDHELIGYCFDTAVIAPQVRGYGGPIHVLVAMDLNGRLVGLEIREHSETPFFVRDFKEPWFTQQFVGKGVSDPLRIGQDLDGISGATISSRAVATGIRESLATMAATFLGTGQVRGGQIVGGHRWGLETVVMLGLMALVLVAYFRKKRKTRVIILMLCIGFLGFYLKSFLSVVHIVNLLSLRFPPLPGHAAWYLLVLFGAITALLVGRLYCGWLCPFGALQEFLKKLVPYRLRPSTGLRRRASRLRVVLLWLVLCLVLISGNQELLRYEPFSIAFRLKGTLLMWTSLVLILGASVVIDRFWCRYFCVVGAALHLLGNLGLRRKKPPAAGGEEMTGAF